jgi:hypothetical protein
LINSREKIAPTVPSDVFWSLKLFQTMYKVVRRSMTDDDVEVQDYCKLVQELESLLEPEHVWGRPV